MENKGYYLFKNGELFEFWELKLKKIKFGRETGALRVRTTLNEVNVVNLSHN